MIRGDEVKFSWLRIGHNRMIHSQKDPSSCPTCGYPLRSSTYFSNAPVQWNTHQTEIAESSKLGTRTHFWLIPRHLEN